MTESTSTTQTAHDAQAALASIDAARTGLGDLLDLPPGYDARYAMGTGVLVAGIGISNAPGAGTVQWIAGIALVFLALLIVGRAVARFRALNGVWISGFRPRRARWVAVATALTCLAFGALAAWGASTGRWGVFAVAVVAAIATSYGLSRLWLRIFLAELSAR